VNRSVPCDVHASAMLRLHEGRGKERGADLSPGTRCEYIPVRSKAASMPPRVPGDRSAPRSIRPRARRRGNLADYARMLAAEGNRLGMGESGWERAGP